MKLTYKYKPITNLLLGVLCAYSVCACNDVQKITPTDTNTDNDQANTQYDQDPTDTDSDKPGDQNNQNDQDNQWEQPDENHQENPTDQDTPVEQPDENHQDPHNDQDTPVEQPDQDTPETPDEQPDQDTPVDPTDVCHGEGCQGNRGCKPGYFWTEAASNFVDTGGDPDYHCVPCINGPISFVDYLRNGNYYCPGGDDLRGIKAMDQIEKCPEHTVVTNSFDDCICVYGVPPPPKEDCHPSSTRKKTIIISPKVNVVRRNNSTTQLLLRNKMRERRTNKR